MVVTEGNTGIFLISGLTVEMEQLENRRQESNL